MINNKHNCKLSSIFGSDGEKENRVRRNGGWVGGQCRLNGLDWLIEIVICEQRLEGGNLLKREEILYGEKQGTSIRVFLLCFLATNSNETTSFVSKNCRLLCYICLRKNLNSLLHVYPLFLLLLFSVLEVC